MGAVDLSKLDARGLHALARFIGIVPVANDKKPLTEEKLRRAIEEHATSA